MKKALKISCLYIGTIIGAGFSSGREIALFFGDTSPINVSLTAIFMAILCAIFLIAGKKGLIPKNALMSFIIFVCAFISLTAMLAGGDFIMYSMTSIPIAFALIMIILAGVIVCFGIEKIKIVSSILVPLMVLCIILIFIKIPHNATYTITTITKPILYSGLDILIGGVIISKEGEHLSYKEIILSCLLTCIFMGVMLYMLQAIVLCDKNNSLMPVLEISRQVNLKAICGVLIAGAIFTTLVSSLNIVTTYIKSILSKSRRLNKFSTNTNYCLIVFATLVVAYPISFIGFDKIVDNVYPIISVCGVVFTLMLLLRLIIIGIKYIKIAIQKQKKAI